MKTPLKKTKNWRSSLYSVVYISKDKKSLLIAKPKPQILRKSKYPNSKVAEPDRYYTKAHLHLEYISRDIRSLNFICHGDNTYLVIFLFWLETFSNGRLLGGYHERYKLQY